jgi:hypothetical protein
MDERKQDSDLKLEDYPRVLATDANLAKPVSSQWEGNPFIKIIMLKSDVLDLNSANNAT